MRGASRRGFLKSSALLAGLPRSEAANVDHGPVRQIETPLDGEWLFRIEPGDWEPVQVPHTWQIDPRWSEYRGMAWYRRELYADTAWSGSVVRIEFEAVFHTARVSINGNLAGEHIGKGYTAFSFDITPHLRLGQTNTVEVQADNRFDDRMLPRNRSSDWAHDGGIYRPVRLLVTPPAYVDRIAVDAVPDLTRNEARIEISAFVRNAGATPWQGRPSFRVVDDGGRNVLSGGLGETTIAPGETRSLAFAPATLPSPKLWHFDRPNLYRLEIELGSHSLGTTFGIRSIEFRDAAMFLNGERVRLMGVERMAGSNPDYGISEPAAWIRHDHEDLKELNCVFTRVHWPQDQRVLDYCDRHGILIQVEVPAWGPDTFKATFKGMGTAPATDILNNGLEQLREMILRDRNHPCIFAWGLCNETNGQNPPAAQFARVLYAEAKQLDPRRACSYASNSLQHTPERDVAAEMDFIAWNEYYETWYKGSTEELRKNLELIRNAFPGKMIVISEYGYCACTADRPEGDPSRIRILRQHDAVFREFPEVGGLIFFCYNDYRTHVGDKGTGALQQRVHGVVDLYGARKPSFEVLREESSPLAALNISGSPEHLELSVTARATVPCYKLQGYRVRAIAYGPGNVPVEKIERPLPVLLPGGTATLAVELNQREVSTVRIDALRPNGYSALTRFWRKEPN